MMKPLVWVFGLWLPAFVLCALLATQSARFYLPRSNQNWSRSTRAHRQTLDLKHAWAGKGDKRNQDGGRCRLCELNLYDLFGMADRQSAQHDCIHHAEHFCVGADTQREHDPCDKRESRPLQ